ncbi:unnamed protein product [Sphagnum balticum]
MELMELSLRSKKAMVESKRELAELMRKERNTPNMRYLPLELIGCGGFGEVYRGFDIERCQDVAIKMNILDSKYSTEALENLYKHLKREINIHKQLVHPNIARMVDQLEV